MKNQSRYIELDAEMRNNLQAAITALTMLMDGKKVSGKMLAIAKRDLEKAIVLLNNQK